MKKNGKKLQKGRNVQALPRFIFNQLNIEYIPIENHYALQSDTIQFWHTCLIKNSIHIYSKAHLKKRHVHLDMNERNFLSVRVKATGA